MISLILTVTVLGLIVWLVTTYVPLPQPFKVVIYVIAAICLLVLLAGAFGVGDIPVPQIR